MTIPPVHAPLNQPGQRAIGNAFILMRCVHDFGFRKLQNTQSATLTMIL